MAEPLRHRQTKGAETDMPSLPPPRHIPTLPDSAIRLCRPEGRVCAQTSAVRPSADKAAGFDRGRGKTRHVTWATRRVSRLWTVETPVDRLSGAVCARRSGSDRRHQRSDTENPDHSLEVIGQNV